MDSTLIRLSSEETDAIVTTDGDGSLSVDSDALARVISRALGVIGVRIAVSSADYLEHENGTVESATRSLSGVWWLSHGDDTALVGGFVMHGLALTITTEGEGESPLAEDVDVLDRATKAIASQYEGAEILEVGLVKVRTPSGEKMARVVVTRDYRVRRPQDILSTDETDDFKAGRLGLGVVQVIGGEKALVIKHNI